MPHRKKIQRHPANKENKAAAIEKEAKETPVETVFAPDKLLGVDQP